ncbi:MAG: histidine triad nucleotide-binding protein [Ferrovum sp. 37-45-19]|uniref:histidine triad nucleotide-binding protein n=1 Tax=Ferrovum sp. JA12 TaxID=1356299 RepID=UPI000702960E|nr:histidine triad nucleotide-binding protein [Ferrovum sp. JA12]OYV79628.1 MAG: histidine triad nucleotide-binding protein [Ferrovum sp. 21-44-67]OYV94577.1 MAG: histidine triad nucleotide-binding protein [Ferrovum sp. 37-45-19]OZB34594.1 MAG: histidine triad nucleotide-binding protein [Ferrovum sp. 34-44-207]HQT81555.1 histidine triad nucleotide-binding protein [Ferrovaceae bacterium]KRH79527.1 HIT-like protein [Ferrovum sp. JA12]
MSDCVFCNIIAGQIPSKKIYEDEDVFVFHDIRPHMKVHFMIIPKKHIPTLMDCQPEDRDLLGKIMLMTSQLAKQEGLSEGYKTLVNTGKAGGQEVFHLHVHVMGGGSL